MKTFLQYLREEQTHETMNGIRISRPHYAAHNITNEHLDFITSHPDVQNGIGPVTLRLPKNLGTLMNGLYGPVMGDPPVTENTPGVHMANRGDGRPPSRMIHGEHRPTNKVTAVVIPDPEKEGRKWLVTTYGGPSAPREPNDPSHPNEESRKESEKFWSEHALLTGNPQP